MLTIGIDATNLRLGGGITHLSELLLAADPKRDGFIRIVVWGGAKTLSQLPQRPWLSCVDCDFWQANLFLRVFMQVFLLSRLAKKAGCDLLFIPGGSYAGSFHPVITMSQSVLPFDWLAIKSNGWSFRALKFMLLRWVQASSFRRSDGVIFLTQFAKKMVLAQMGSLSVPTAVIAHGLASQFYGAPKVQQQIAAYSSEHPFVLLYVSIIDTYKHQVEVVKAAALLRSLGYPVQLRLVGPAHASSLLQLQKVMLECDPQKAWIDYIGPVSHQQLSSEYAKADLGIVASSCESFGMIGLEKMAAGLPLACANQGAMMEVLQEAALFFDPKNPTEIAQVIQRYIDSPELRSQKQSAGVKRAREFIWETCASQTFAFMHTVYERTRSKIQGSKT